MIHCKGGTKIIYLEKISENYVSNENIFSTIQCVSHENIFHATQYLYQGSRPETWKKK